MDEIDEISQGPRDDDRPSSKRSRWLVTGAIAGVAAAAAALLLTRGGEPRVAAAPPAPSASSVSGATARATPPVPQPTGLRLSLPNGVSGLQVVTFQDAPGGAFRVSLIVTPGTLREVIPHSPLTLDELLRCQSASTARLGPGWRAGSLRVGPAWFVGGTRLGYVHLGRGAPAAAQPPGRAASSRTVEMLMHIATGSVVQMQVATGAKRYFQFLNGDGLPLAGGGESIFGLCPANGTDVYRLGFSIAPGHAASVEVWTSTNGEPVWLTFTAPTAPAAG